MDRVILVDEWDNEIGTMEKLEAHQKGALHRAFSVLLFNSKGEMLLQKRAKNKYHSGGLWSNACCSHPRPGEEMQKAVSRRLKEELGVDLNPIFSYKFIYNVVFTNSLIEHEFDHVFVGTFDGSPKINKKEIDEWKFVNQKELEDHVNTNPNQFTHWFKMILSNNLTPREA
ncbi:MAG: isopentenyl-diphosphate Delta-isomerase [Cyclobacteriaceae bacterium]